MKSESALREEIVALGRSMFERGLTFGGAGSLSVRLRDGWLMTPTNASLGRLRPARLSKLDAKGAPVSGDLPTNELSLHLAMYAERRDARAVVHLHSTYAVLLACRADVNPNDVLAPLTPSALMELGRVPLVPYAMPGDTTLATAVRKLAGKHAAMLLANHGPIVAGTSLDAAANAIEELEETAKLHLLLAGLPTRTLTAQQIAEIEERYSP